MDFIIEKKLIEKTGEKKSRSYLIQRVSMAIEKGNVACISSGIPKVVCDGA